MPTCGNEIIFPKFLKHIVATRGSNCDKSTEWSIIAVAKGLTVALQDLSTNRKPLKSFSGSSVVSAILCVVSGDRSAVVSETLCPCSPILLTYATCDIGIVVSTPPTIIVMWSNASNSFTSPTIAVYLIVSVCKDSENKSNHQMFFSKWHNKKHTSSFYLQRRY